MVKESTMTTMRVARGLARQANRTALRQAELSKARSEFDKKPVNDVWRELQRLPDDSPRRRLIRNYFMERFLPLVRYNAERIHTRLPDEVDIEDLMSAGVFGLMDAIDAFDLERKVKFETYCAPRIRGAILDELRSMDWVPRLVRHRTSKFEQARQQIEMATGVSPTDDQVADRLGLAGEEFDKLKRDSFAVNTRSLTQRCFNSDGNRDVREIDVIKDESQHNPSNEAQRRDLKDLITKGLSRAERLIVILYYYEAMTMKEIGATLDLSESRVSQMHSSILLRLKAQMQHRTKELEEIEE
jgi:RNA polymerase sigma factor for flagellar operon FliA